MKAPVDSAIMEYCYREAVRKSPEELKWGETGPKLLNKAVKIFDLWGYVVCPEEFCPVDFWSWRIFLEESPEKNLLSKSQAVHLWNEMWRRDNVDKSGDFSENSIYEQLKKAYLSR